MPSAAKKYPRIIHGYPRIKRGIKKKAFEETLLMYSGMGVATKRKQRVNRNFAVELYLTKFLKDQVHQ